MKELARSLAPDEALLEYLVTPDHLVIFVLTERGLTVRSVEERASELRSRVQLARALVQRRDAGPAARGVLSALFELLIEPVVETGALDGVRTLTLVPHGPLSYVPFSALIDRRTGRYAVEEWSFLRVPTAASLPSLREPTRTRPTIGGPALVDVFAPFPDSLPATGAEARSVHRAYPTGAVFIGARANKATLRSALQTADVVHIATHARMNSRNPLFSEIELAGTASGSSDAPGRFEVHELLGLHARSSLVFLSGCETALGSSWATGFDMGEDYTTIAQTFLYAGVRDVVATLWRIDDEGAAVFAAHFYAALNHGSVPDALARAQRDLVVDPKYRSPYYWAAYEVSGGGSPPVNLANRAELSDKR